MIDRTDQVIIDVIKERFEFNRKALHDLGDLTRKLERTNLKLQESEALKSHFLSNIRNEINNPLAAILGLARQLTTEEADAKETSMMAALIFVEAFQLDFQLRNIFAAAELEAGEALPDPARFEVVAIIADVEDSLRHQAQQKGITVRRLGPDRLHFNSDASKFRLMVSNLLANALEFTAQGGEIDIEVGLAGEELRVVVRDNGPGIDPTDFETVFDRFCQLDSGSTKGHRGHGLGLSVTRALAQLLGGTVGLASCPGEGAVFTLSLPSVEVGSDASATDGNMFLFARVGEEF